MPTTSSSLSADLFVITLADADRLALIVSFWSGQCVIRIVLLFVSFFVAFDCEGNLAAILGDPLDRVSCKAFARASSQTLT
jgi:hypothetical protein